MVEISSGNIEWTLNLTATIIALGLARLSTIGALKLKPDTTPNYSIIFPEGNWSLFVFGICIS